MRACRPENTDKWPHTALKHNRLANKHSCGERMLPVYNATLARTLYSVSHVISMRRMMYMFLW